MVRVLRYMTSYLQYQVDYLYGSYYILALYIRLLLLRVRIVRATATAVGLGPRAAWAGGGLRREINIDKDGSLEYKEKT